MSPTVMPAGPKLQLLENEAPSSVRISPDSLNDNAAKVAHRRDRNITLRFYMLTDAIALVVGCLFAWGFTGLLNDFFFDGSLASHAGTGSDSARLVQFIGISAAVLLWFQHLNHYRLRMPFWLEAKNIIGTLVFAMMADGFLQFASKQDVSRMWLMSGWLIAGFCIIGLRAGLRAALRKTGHYQMRTLLIGDGETAQYTRAALKSERTLGYKITAQIKDLPSAFIKAGRSWEQLCAMHNADYVMVALDGKDLAACEQPLAQLMREDVPFSISPPLRHLPVHGMTPQFFFSHDTMLLTRSSGLEQPLPRFLKRAVDVLVSGTALLLASPLMLVLAILVRMDGGKALFGHMRIGKDGKAFPCYKFRSMVTNGDEVLKKHLAESAEARAEWEADRKLKNDPRITKIGQFLRKSSLDELPQLINVLRGEMSLVGPRPIVMAEVAKYDNDIAHYYRVRPGITGLWQVSGRNDVSYPKRVQMDSWYVRNWSLWHDIAIICKTFPALLKREGVY